MNIQASNTQKDAITDVSSNSNTQPQISISDFLAAFYPDAQEQIHLRSFKPKGAPDSTDNSPKKYVLTKAKLTFSTSDKSRIIEDNQTRGIYFVVNAGGGSDKDITRYNAFFVESDSLSMEQQHVALDASPVPPSIRTETKKSVHAYWLIEGECSEVEWRVLQQRLITYFNGDPANKNPSRVMRLPGFNHVSYNGVDDYSYKPVEVVTFEPNQRHTVAHMRAAFPALVEEPKTESSKKLVPLEETDYQESSALQFHSWDELNAELRKRIITHPTAKMQKDGWWHCKGICHGGSGDTAIMFDQTTGAVKCMAKCSHAKLLAAFGLPTRPLLTSLRLVGSAPVEGDVARKEDALEVLIHAPLTDAGNAECMSALYSSNMRFCHTRNKWLLWDGIRWRVDGCKEAIERSVNMARARQQAAMGDDDFQTKKHVMQWGHASESISRITASLTLASTIKPFGTTIDKYDADTLLATTKNGTLDLCDGTFRESNPEDYLTKQLGATFLPEAKAPRWELFLQEVFGGDEELIKYIQVAVGYCLTGETKEQNLFLCYGSGANGKSVFLQIVSQLLGDYAGAASFESFNAGNRNEAGYDLAVLKGKRLVTVIEANEDRFLDEAKVKAVTGQDLISCRFLHKDFFSYRPQFKIWMAMNYKPIVRGTDYGIWRRIHLIPFTQSFKSRADKDLVVKLGAELSGILNWALVGLREWQESGLEIPQAVKKATQEYQRESDSIGQWLEERTTRKGRGVIRASKGHHDYQVWAERRGERPFGVKNWGRSLVERGFQNGRDKDGAFYYGLELISETPDWGV